MDESRSRYSCDSCRSHKIRCSRESSGCKACENSGQDCLYSRSGVIRRNRRRNNGATRGLERPGGSKNTVHASNKETTRTSSEVDTSIPTPEEGLRLLGGDRFSAVPLPLLFSESTSFWQDSDFIDMFDRMKSNDSQFFTFEHESAEWIKVVQDVLEQGEPLMAPIPTEKMRKITLNPESVKEKGYSLMFYGLMLTVASSDSSFSDNTRMKLKWNLWLCLNDARLLLQPSEINIQALTLLACHVQDFHTPSLCWMVSTTAFRMFQALGALSPWMDAETKQRRAELFWFLNALDKLLALIFGRPPVFHRSMSKDFPMPPMQRLRLFQPHIKIQAQNRSISDSPQSLYGAHLLHQMHLMSTIMADVWHYLFEPCNRTSTVDEMRQRLTSWHEETVKVLEASLLTERPFLDAVGIRALELGLTCIRFQFHYLTVLLVKSHKHFKEECLESSRNALLLLNGLISDSIDVYNGVVWQLLYCPFTPFFVLFAHVNANPGSAKSTSTKSALEAMEHLPVFLKEMSSRHPLARKLYEISVALFDQAKLSTEGTVRGATSRRANSNLLAVSSDTRDEIHNASATSNGNNRLNHADFLRGFFPDSNLQVSPVAGGSENETIMIDENQSVLDISPLISSGQQYNFLADSMFDWFAWESSGDNQAND